MSETLTGWVRGKTLELDTEAPELDGKHVRVMLEPIDESAPDTVAVASSTSTDHWTGEAEMQWLSEHHDEFVGRWVALDGDRLIAVGDEARDVYAEAHARGVESPFVTFVAPNEPYCGGWL